MKKQEAIIKFYNLEQIAILKKEYQQEITRLEAIIAKQRIALEFLNKENERLSNNNLKETLNYLKQLRECNT